MKNTAAAEKFTPREAEYDPSLDVYTNVSLFPKKMEQAAATIKKYGLPPHIKRVEKNKKSAVSTLQNELLTVFSLDPSEQQMQELKAFLYQLFGEQINKTKQKEEMVA